MRRRFSSPLCRFVAGAAALAVAAAFVPDASAAGFGDATGQVVLDGEAPKLAPVPVPKGAAACGANPKDFRLVLGKGNGIAHVFLYPSRPIRNVNPALKAPKNKTIEFDQLNCVFKPHALIVRTDQTVELFNSDPFPHNVRFTSFGNPGVNKNVPAGLAPGPGVKGIPVKFRRAQQVPIPALCDFHPWMKSNWLIVDHPYAALTDEDGNFEIKGLPAGKHTFTVWHESAGFLDRTLTIEVKPNAVTKLGKLKYDLAAFKQLKK